MTIQVYRWRILVPSIRSHGDLVPSDVCHVNDCFLSLLLSRRPNVAPTPVPVFPPRTVQQVVDQHLSQRSGDLAVDGFASERVVVEARRLTRKGVVEGEQKAKPGCSILKLPLKVPNVFGLCALGKNPPPSVRGRRSLHFRGRCLVVWDL